MTNPGRHKKKDGVPEPGTTEKISSGEYPNRNYAHMDWISQIEDTVHRNYQRKLLYVLTYVFSPQINADSMANTVKK